MKGFGVWGLGVGGLGFGVWGLGFKEVREKNHVSQSVLAAYLCVTVKAVQRWEQGTSKPSGATAKLLAIAEKKGLQAIA